MDKNRHREFLKVIKEPILTDKTTKLLEKNQYCFKVNHKIDKTTIKQAIEYIFKVKVNKINFHGYKAHYKKAIVTLSKNDKINLFSE